MYRGGKLKAFHLAFVFLLASLPAGADELPQTGNALRAAEPELAEPGSFKWTVVDAAGEAPASAVAEEAATEKEAQQNSAPAQAALAQIRAQTQRILGEAHKNAAKVSRIRYDLHLRCVVEQVDVEPDELAEVALPYIWGADGEKEPVTGTLEMCEVDYSQKVRSQPLPKAERAPEAVDYKVAFPVD